jgi:hypothetical protein
VHDIFDEILVVRQIDDPVPPPFTMTTWHANDPLGEAVFFALQVVQPDHCGDEWQLTSLPRNLLVIGSVATWDQLVAAVHAAPDAPDA